MIGILLITHAPLGRAFVEAATHVFRNPPERVEALDVIADQDPDEVRLPLVGRPLRALLRRVRRGGRLVS